MVGETIQRSVLNVDFFDVPDYFALDPPNPQGVYENHRFYPTDMGEISEAYK